MRREDAAEFAGTLEGMMGLYGVTLTKPIKAIWWRALESYDFARVSGAFSEHVSDPDRGQYVPKPADIIRRLGAHQPKHIGADEAWSLVLRSFDEAESVLLTDQIAAARVAAKPVWDSGDRVGARFTFRSAYERELDNTRQPPRWYLSPGWDPERRAVEAQRALEQGRLPHEAVEKYLPPPEPSQDMQAVAGLLTGNVTQHPASSDAKTAERLREVKRAISKGVEQRVAEREAKRAQREEESRRRHEARHGELSEAERQRNLQQALHQLDQRKRA